MSTKETFDRIKELVHQVLPDAKVTLFGSRASGQVWEESDWDILIVDKGDVTKKTKDALHDALYPLSVEIGSFIHFIATSELDWNTHPQFYSLKLSIENNPVIA